MTLETPQAVPEVRSLEEADGAFFIAHGSDFFDGMVMNRVALQQVFAQNGISSTDEAIQNLSSGAMEPEALPVSTEVSGWVHRMLGQQKSISRLRQLREDCIEEMRATNEYATVIIDHIFPTIVKITESVNPADELQTFVDALSEYGEQGKNIQSALRSALDTFEYNIVEELRTVSDQGIHTKPIIPQLIAFMNDAFLDSCGFCLSRLQKNILLNGRTVCIQTLGLQAILEKTIFNAHAMDVTCQKVCTIFPKNLDNKKLGTWDGATLSASVFLDVASVEAASICDTLAGQVNTDTNLQYAKVIHEKYGTDEEKIYDVFIQETLCEEMKHGLNYAERNTLALSRTSTGIISPYESRKMYAQTRLGNGVLRRQWLIKQYCGEQHENEYLRVVEELNAKLTTLMIGPHPKAGIERVIWHALEEEGTKEEYLILLQLIAVQTQSKPNASIAEHADHLRAVIATKNEGDIRLFIQKIIAAEFTDDILQTPFCALDAQGNLVRHAGTMDEFAEWMDT